MSKYEPKEKLWTGVTWITEETMMTFNTPALKDRSKEWRYWREHYIKKGLRGTKLLKVLHRKMRRKYGIG